MPVLSSEVRVGAIFITAGNQLRKVTEITKDDQARTRVNYFSKSAKIPNQKFTIIHTIASPPLLDTFIADCDHLLSQAEIAEFRQSNIILSNE